MEGTFSTFPLDNGIGFIVRNPVTGRRRRLLIRNEGRSEAALWRWLASELHVVSCPQGCGEFGSGSGVARHMRAAHGEEYNPEAPLAPYVEGGV